MNTLLLAVAKNVSCSQSEDFLRIEFHSNSKGNFKHKITRFMQTTPNAIYLLIIKRFPNHKISRKKTRQSYNFYRRIIVVGNEVLCISTKITNS